ncbi:MAG: hypothetical protein ACK2VA_14710 [Anaerolineae bacterium]
MRIALYTETFLPKYDGVTNTLCYLLEYLAERGHASIMFAPKGAPPPLRGNPDRGPDRHQLSPLP